MAAPVKIYVLNHSHTDIGYTEPQGRIARWHADFIRQALSVVREGRERVGDDFSGYKWNCECFWSVEQFLRRATAAEIEHFEQAVGCGKVGLSASYLNLSELLDYPVLYRMVKRAADFGRSLELTVDSAMTADINGYSWGFCRALLENGVENLFTCIHTHHGMYPLGRQQVGFWWESPSGEKLLVWSGEHYHFGNELGIVPGACASYLTKDECDAQMIFHQSRAVAEIRIPRYVEKLRSGGYSLDIIPVMVSGLRTDNAPPSARIIDFIADWNAAHGDEIYIKMATLSEFFKALRQAEPELPTYRGDWPDWWSDGPAGDAEATLLFREAQRRLRHLEALSAHFPQVELPDLYELDEQLCLYAEHTFSHSDSVNAPWYELTKAISGRKRAYAATAYDTATALTDAALESVGATPLTDRMPLRYKVVNPYQRPVRGIAALSVGHFEYCELNLDKGGVVVDGRSGEVLPTQVRPVPRGAEFCVPLTLAPGQSVILDLVPDSIGHTLDAQNTALTRVETPQVRISWEGGQGITEWRDADGGFNLLSPTRRHAPFTLVHEITPCPDRSQVGAVRGAMGLNRKGPDVIRTAAYLEHGRLIRSGDVFTQAELSYDCAGMTDAAVTLTAHHHAPIVEVSVRYNKDSNWEPENVYLSLPFAIPGMPAELWLDKAGAALRPYTDQLPGTLTDYYSVQDGFGVCCTETGVGVGMLSGHLLQLGPLNHEKRLLSGDEGIADQPRWPYAWLQTNYWETNFSATLGGFQEFRFIVTWGSWLRDPRVLIDTIRDLATGITCFRLRE